MAKIHLSRIKSSAFKILSYAGLSVIDHSDIDSSWNSDQDSWFSPKNSPGHPPISLESPTTEADPHEAMAEEQPLASQLTEFPVVMAKELARLQQELQSVQDSLVDECNLFNLVSQTFELEMKAAQPSLAHKQKQFLSTTNSEEGLQTVNGPSCTPTLAYQNGLAAGNDIPRVQEYSFHSQSLSDISPAQADASYINPGSLPYPGVDCIPACRDTLVPDGILQRHVLPRPKPKPWLSKKDIPPWPDVPKLQKDVPPWPHVPRPQPKPRLSLKWTSEVLANPETISHQDSPVPSTVSGDVYCCS